MWSALVRSPSCSSSPWSLSWVRAVKILYFISDTCKSNILTMERIREGLFKGWMKAHWTSVFYSKIWMLVAWASSIVKPGTPPDIYQNISYSEWLVIFISEMLELGNYLDKCMSLLCPFALGKTVILYLLTSSHDLCVLTCKWAFMTKFLKVLQARVWREGISPGHASSWKLYSWRDKEAMWRNILPSEQSEILDI